MADIIQIRRDTAANFTSVDPTLAQGEMGYELDTGKLKFGDGSTAWTSLGYFGGIITAHNTSHQSGGSDSIKLDDLAAPDDNTALNVSTSAHGLTPKLSNVATQYLDGTGAYSVPAGGADANAIHDNAASEISAIAEKVTPVSADLLIIEDSADSNNKKKVQVGNLPGGGGGSTKIAVGHFGGKFNSVATFVPHLGKSTDVCQATSYKVRCPIPAAGTLSEVSYQCRYGDTTTQMKIHINGTVEETFTLSDIGGTYNSGVETVSVSVLAGDVLELEYDDFQKPGEGTWIVMMELS